MFYLAYLCVTGPLLLRRHARDVADARARDLLLARALGHARQRVRRGLRRDRGLQHRLAANGRLQRDRPAPLVLPVGRLPVHRRRDADRSDLLLRRLQPHADRGPRRAQRDDRGPAAAARSPKWRHDRRGGVRLRHRRRRDRRLRGRGAAVGGPQRVGLPARGRPVGRRRRRDPAPRGLDVPPGLGLRLGLPGRAPGEGQQLPAPRPREGARRLLVAQLVHRLLDAARGPRRVGGDGLRRAGARTSAGRSSSAWRPTTRPATTTGAAARSTSARSRRRTRAASPSSRRPPRPACRRRSSTRATR